MATACAPPHRALPGTINKRRHDELGAWGSAREAMVARGKEPREREDASNGGSPEMEWR
jgi:hypothetical protein